MAFLDATIVNIAFPALQRAFPGDGSSSISWVLNAYNIVFAALMIPAGQLAERYSQRRLFLAGLALFTVASGCCALAPTLGALIAARVIQAVGAAILIPTGMALLLPAFSPGEQIKAIALLAAVSGVAFAAGPSIGGVLVNTVGWQGIFLVNVPIGVVTLVMASRVIHESPRHEVNLRFPDLLGALAILAGVGLLALAIVQGNSWGWMDARTIAALLGAACVIAVAIRRSKRHEAPAIQLDLFGARRFTVANIAIFAFAIGLAAKLLCDVLFMTSVWHYSELKTGAAVSASPLITAALATSAARVAIRIGQRTAATLGGLLYAAGCLWYVERMGLEPHYLSSYLPGAVLTGTGIALILPTLTSTAMLSVPSPRLAAGAGINSMIRQIGAVLGVALFIAIVGSPRPADALAAFHHGWTLAAISSTVAALATMTLLTSAEPRSMPIGALRNRARAT
jgi:EmrB/QacA subfamily drug resistance transporter